MHCLRNVNGVSQMPQQKHKQAILITFNQT